MQQQLGQAGLEAQLRRQQETIEEPYTRLAIASAILRSLAGRNIQCRLVT